MSTATESTTLATRDEASGELMAAYSESAAQHEIQAAVILAKRFPRNEDAAYQQLMKSCQRPTFAGDVTYSFRRGGSVISGPTVYLAREFARIWGNIQYGSPIVHDTAETRTIRAWAWDLQTNTRSSQDVTFRKLVQRKRDGTTQWVEPDERDLRELTNKQAALAVRNCLLQLLPSDMVEDAIGEAQRTLESKAAQDPESTRKNLIKAFAGLGVTVENLEAYVGHKLAQCSPAQLVELRQLYKGVKDGSTTWQEAAAARVASQSKVGDLAAKLGQKNGSGPVKVEAPPVDMASAETLAKLKAAIKDQEQTEQQVAATMQRLGLTGDPLKLGEADMLRLVDEILNPTLGDAAE